MLFRSEEIAFQSLLRLAAKNDTDLRDDRTLLYSAAVRLSRDWYGRKLRKTLAEPDLRSRSYVPLNGALLSLLRRSFPARLAAGLTAAGFSGAEIRRIGGMRAAAALGRIPGAEMEAARTAAVPEDRVSFLSDRVYERFSERSVSVENAIHEVRMRFDRLAPVLALAVLAFFLFCVWFSKRQG